MSTNSEPVNTHNLNRKRGKLTAMKIQLLSIVMKHAAYFDYNLEVSKQLLHDTLEFYKFSIFTVVIMGFLPDFQTNLSNNFSRFYPSLFS